MKKQRIIKTFALLLVFSLCMSILPSSVFAVSEDESANDTTPTLEDFLAGNATAEDIYGVLDESTVPEIIGYEEAVRKNHVQRLYEDEGEDLNKVVFLNVDGSKTMYTFDFPVKYIDKDGNIRDITLEIADSTTHSGEFESAANPATTTFSAQFTDGITLKGSSAEIRLVPVLSTVGSNTATMSSTSPLNSSSNSVLEAQRIDENTIEYRYNDVTTVEYSLTYTGFKEDIVVTEYTGQTEYPFHLYTNGLALEEIGGSYFLVDDNGDIQATIGDIIIFTADERNNAFGSIVPMTVVENEEYLLTIVVDADYLADPNTTYPIRIDPTVEIDYNDGDSAIEDITITTNTNYTGSHTSLYVGRRSTEGIARALMRFPGLDLSGLGGATVTSASVCMRDLMCEDTSLDISCHVFTGNVWDANAATWGSVSPDSYVATALSTNTLSWAIGNAFDPIHWYYFDITSAVQGWIDGNYAQNKGIIFKASSTVENGSTIANRTFGSYNRASYKPSLSVTYEPKGTQIIANGTYYLNNRGTGKYMQKTTSGTPAGVSGLLSSIQNTVQWEIQKVSNGYVIRAANDPTKYLSGTTAGSSSVTILTVSDSALPAMCVWTFISATGGGYLIKNVYTSRYLYSSGGYLYTATSTGSTGTSTYDSRVWRIASTSYYGNSSSYSARELTPSTSIAYYSSSVGKTSSPNIRKGYSSEIWCDPADFTYSRNTTSYITINSLTGAITGVNSGTTTVTATHKVTGRTITFTAYIEPLLVYQTAATYYYDAHGNYAADMTYADMTKDDMRALDWIDWTDFLLYPPTYYESEWRNMVILMFSEGDLETVAWDMIDHFMGGSGNVYSNDLLTNAIVAHSETTDYTSSVQGCIEELLNEQNGNMASLLYSAVDRENSLLVNRMKDNNIYSPVYNSPADYIGGLTICVDSLWGVEIQVTQYSVNGSTYTCKLHYKFYDHFGLDETDVEKYGLLDGFKDWFILQHYSGYNGAYRPFLTMMEFDVTFTGTIS